jgi:uncharacterized membrane protein YkvA (DUF1232 family)
MDSLTDFQRAAVERIVERFKESTNGSRRFLLADEVGLGKTLVARGVIGKLREAKNGKGYTVVYVCSNSEIAEQNRIKLYPEQQRQEANHRASRRLTLLSLESAEIARRRKCEIQVFSFTPGTSLQLTGSTGIALERRLLMYLLHRLWHKPVRHAIWREFFRCGCREKPWNEWFRGRRLAKEFRRQTTDELRKHLSDAWGQQRVKFEDPATCQVKEGPLGKLIDDCVHAFDDSRAARRNRRVVIGALRESLASVSLSCLQPDLVILDEFQKFSEILKQSSDPHTIVGQLFTGQHIAALILSATPYRMYALSYEDQSHRDDFMRTLAFLRKDDSFLADGKTKDPDMLALQCDLDEFRERLKEGKCLRQDEAGEYKVDPDAHRLKTQIEQRLSEVMCRTERNWYIEDPAKGVQEVPPNIDSGHVPGQSEMMEYIALRRFLLGHGLEDWKITDFWKSSPSILSFMDRHYRLIEQIDDQRLQIPPNLLLRPDDLTKISRSNLKFRMLFHHLFPGEDANLTPARPEPWRFLWMRPTYTYYQGDFYGQQDKPRKFLVFSHWKFVPKAISVLVSEEIERRLPGISSDSERSPLQFRQIKGSYPSFSVFNVCYPSAVLAERINQLSLAAEIGSLPAQRELLYKKAKKVVERLLDEGGIKVERTSNAPLWRIIARLEAISNPTRAREVRQALSSARSKGMEDKDESGEYYPEYRRQYVDWMGDQQVELRISAASVDRLTRIALYSPAVCLKRTLDSVFGPGEPVLPELMSLCLSQLRCYFNKPVVQAVIRRHGRRNDPFYWSKVLDYCRDAHFQSAMDEYGYLLYNVLQEKKVPDFVAHLGRVLGMGTGTPRVNAPRGGRMSGSRPRRAHFAMAFGDDVEALQSEAKARSRKSAMREAFNSPFWPFVLATTSVGQEGLDFHLYCRDVVHWNLPSNPVDLEQREGRINRYDGLAIRRNIQRDFPLDRLEITPKTRENIWRLAFATACRNPKGRQRFNHGLFPHWIYQPQVQANDDKAEGLLRRHLLFFSGSRDAQRYTELKTALSLYRLVLGQPRQQDILETMLRRFPNMPREQLANILRGYMINLSPVQSGHALKMAKEEAELILNDHDRLQSLMVELDQCLKKGSAKSFSCVSDELEMLKRIATGGFGNKVPRDGRLKAIAALIYVLNPFDDSYDFLPDVGLQDDVDMIRLVHSELVGATRSATASTGPAN